ncbi:hypothetical protein PIB30_069551 [Stylosanthes scabra]|uniref:Uncharacterized protein n=1 Tax=Stylosanthes scabra TaxID=79078 RepID=A0ABU6RP56_9FABA|nr:hypothetical protein [Stylosanthes scabra]
MPTPRRGPTTLKDSKGTQSQRLGVAKHPEAQIEGRSSGDAVASSRNAQRLHQRRRKGKEEVDASLTRSAHPPPVIDENPYGSSVFLAEAKIRIRGENLAFSVMSSCVGCYPQPDVIRCPIDRIGFTTVRLSVHIAP